MVDFKQPERQAEARIDPSARQGMRRFLAAMDADQLTAFVRDCLRAVDRKVAVAIFNDNILGLPMPSSSDRARMTAVLRGVLRAGRPDGFECLQDLTSHLLEKALTDEQYESYSTAVDELNEAAGAGSKQKITAAAKKVVAAMRAGMDDAAITRYVTVHALPETYEALLAAAKGKAAASGKAAAKSAAASGVAEEAAAAEATAGKSTRKTTAKKAAAKKTAAKKTTAKKGMAKGTAAKRSTAGKASGKRTTARKISGKK
jgi:hypothetical protein